MESKLVDAELLKTFPLPDWDDETHKGDRGKLLLIAGSIRIPGAAILAARAALRTGCGSVRLAAPESIALHIGIAVPELMVIPLPETKTGTAAKDALSALKEHVKACDAAVVGPGLDEDSETQKLAEELIQHLPLPTVVDAHALVGFKGKAKAARILTPHPREFESALLEKELDPEKSDETLVDFAHKTGAVVVLKGRHTLIAGSDKALYRNEAGSRALGTAGSGDVLSGIIGSLLAQGVAPEAAAVWGVHLHAQAGEAVAKDGAEDGVMARDFIDRLPGIQKYLRRTTSPKERGRFGLRPV